MLRVHTPSSLIGILLGKFQASKIMKRVPTFSCLLIWQKLPLVLLQYYTSLSFEASPIKALLNKAALFLQSLDFYDT